MPNMKIKLFKNDALLSLYGLFYVSALARARIRPRDDHLTVFPDSCPDADADYNPRIYGNCGIRRLDQITHSWSLHSDDGVYTNIPATVSLAL